RSHGTGRPGHAYDAHRRLRGRVVRRSRPRAGRRRRGHAQCRRHGRAERDASPLEQSRAGARRARRRDHRSEPLVIRYEAADGMGAEFTSQCDVRIASTRARFAWNFVHRGLVPDTGAGTWLLPKIVGLPAALRLLYSGDFLGAEEALAIGYVARVVEPEELTDAAREEAVRYLAGSPLSHKLIKALVYRGLERDLGEHMRHHVEALQACFT